MYTRLYWEYSDLIYTQEFKPDPNYQKRLSKNSIFFMAGVEGYRYALPLRKGHKQARVSLLRSAAPPNVLLRQNSFEGSDPSREQ